MRQQPYLSSEILVSNVNGNGTGCVVFPQSGALFFGNSEGRIKNGEHCIMTMYSIDKSDELSNVKEKFSHYWGHQHQVYWNSQLGG